MLSIDLMNIVFVFIVFHDIYTLITRFRVSTSTLETVRVSWWPTWLYID